MDLDNHIISQTELHKAIGIDSHLSATSIRAKRARILKEIQHYYADIILIHRVEDGSDRRVYNYKITVLRRV